MTTSTSDQKTKRRKASYAMPTKILFAFLGILAAASLPIPTQSFGQRLVSSSTTLSCPKCTPDNYYQQPMHDSSWLSKFPSQNGRFVVSDRTTTTATALGMATKNNDNDDTPKGVLQEENDDLKSIVGAVFVALLAAEFILTPVLKPIMMASDTVAP